MMLPTYKNGDILKWATKATLRYHRLHFLRFSKYSAFGSHLSKIAILTCSKPCIASLQTCSKYSMTSLTSLQVHDKFAAS